jgi:hypothetical protein
MEATALNATAFGKSTLLACRKSNLLQSPHAGSRPPALQPPNPVCREPFKLSLQVLMKEQQQTWNSPTSPPWKHVDIGGQLTNRNRLRALYA